MRGIVVGTVLSLVLWMFLGWCGVCACSWLEDTGLSASTFTLAASLACIVLAAVAGIVWFACLGEDEAEATIGFDLATSD